MPHCRPGQAAGSCGRGRQTPQCNRSYSRLQACRNGAQFGITFNQNHGERGGPTSKPETPANLITENNRFSFFLLKYRCYRILYIPGVQYGESQFVQVIFHLQLFWNIGYTPCAVQFNLLAYFVHNSSHLIILGPVPTPPFPLPTGNH